MSAAALRRDADTARACGIDWLRAETAPAGAFGRAAREREPVFGPGDELAAAEAIARVVAAARAGAPALAALRHDLARVPDVAAAVLRASAGDPLADADLYELAHFSRRVAEIARTAAALAIPHDAALAAEPGPARSELARGLTPSGSFYLSDGFDARLGPLRADANAARTRAELERSRIVRAVAAACGRDVVPDGEFVVMRDRLAGEPPATLRVLRAAPTYLLCEVALDEAALTALALAEVADGAVAACEDDARRRLSEGVARDAAAVLDAIAALGGLDSLVGKAAFAARHACCVPQLVSELALEVANARFLPISESATDYVPLAFALDAANVLTGPNMGGKTTALRTAGFVVTCARLGLPVPATRARVSLFASVVWLAPGEGSPVESGLSAFGAEIANVAPLFERPPSRDLVLIDEFARTTTPREGRALLVALIEGLRDRGALVFAATHASGVAAAADATAFAVAGLRDGPEVELRGMPLAEALAAIRARMDFRIVRDDTRGARRSDAIALARALGLAPHVAARAEALSREG